MPAESNPRSILDGDTRIHTTLHFVLTFPNSILLQLLWRGLPLANKIVSVAAPASLSRMSVLSAQETNKNVLSAKYERVQCIMSLMNFQIAALLQILAARLICTRARRSSSWARTRYI